MLKENRKIANSASEAIEMLWQEGFFGQWRYYKDVSQILGNRGNNFSSQDLGAALRRSVLLLRKGPKGLYRYIQKRPFEPNKIETVHLTSKKVLARIKHSDYVDKLRIRELGSIRNSNFDATRLIELCKELNYSRQGDAYLTIPLLVRSILDHIPPIFSYFSFKEVASNYGSRSFKDSMNHLENSSRKIADSYLHTHIRSKESLPNMTQVNFSNDLDVLLQEICRLLK